MRFLLCFLTAGLLLAGAPSSYHDSIRAWQQHRDAGLLSPDGWLTLVGLVWLKPGDNRIEKFGTLRLEGKRVLLTNPAERGITVNGKPFRSPATLSYDDENPDVVRAGNLSFYVIKRGDKLGARVKDSASPNLKAFHGIPFYPIAPALHFSDARLIPDPKKIPILNVLGQTELEDSPGVVEFSYLGKIYRLRPIFEDQTLFFLFKDPTNKTETYQAGRMLNTPLPVAGKVDLDFNRAYNPPCTFTPYATCPLPPKENTLPFAVKAGEMRYKNGHGE